MTEKKLSIKNVKVASLEAYNRNPRKNDAQVPRMVGLIEQFGFKVPILIRGKRIVDGHLRIKAAKKMGLETVPAIDVGDMPDADEKALRIALNKSVEWAEWDDDLLADEMRSIAEDGLDLKFTGFDPVDVTRLLGGTDDMVGKAVKDALPPTSKTKTADAGTPADPNYVSVTFHMSAEKRDALLKRLQEVRNKEGLPNVSHALVHTILDG